MYRIYIQVEKIRIFYVLTRASPTSAVYFYVLMIRDYCRWRLNEFEMYVILGVSSFLLLTTSLPKYGIGSSAITKNVARESH
jgi:hypothetical protein